MAATNTDSMKWYVLRAVSGKEAKVKEYLDALIKVDDVLQGVCGEVMLPTEKYAQLRGGKRVVKERLFLPGYVLVQCHMSPEVASKLRFTPNVLGFLGGMDTPSPVRQADINRILGTVDETALKVEEMDIPFSIDETVNVVDGPFSGFKGVVEEVQSDKHRLKVSVTIFGRKTPVELTFNQVEKIV